jgi:hypothetical protein
MENVPCGTLAIILSALVERLVALQSNSLGLLRNVFLDSLH